MSILPDTARKVGAPLMPSGPGSTGVLDALLRDAARIGRPLAVHMWLSDEETASLRLIESVGSMPPSRLPLPASHTLGRTLADGCASLEQIESGNPMSDRYGVWRFAFPLNADQVRGVAAIDLAGPDGPDAAALTRLAAETRGALTGALALRVAATACEAARTVLAAATQFNRASESDTIIRSLLAAAVQLADADTGSVMLTVGAASPGLRIVASKGLPAEVVRTTCLGEGEGVAGWVLATGRSAVVEDQEPQRGRGRRHGVCCAVSVPIADEDGRLGVLNVGARAFHGRSTRALTEALEALASAGARSVRTLRARDVAKAELDATIMALASSLEGADPHSRGKTRRVVTICAAIGEAMGMSERELSALTTAAMLYDTGMSAAGGALGGEGRTLTIAEQGMLRLHPEIAAHIVDRCGALRGVASIISHHHERFDGSGYLLGVSGSSIPLGARVLAVADAFVAMTSPRAYRASLSLDAAASEIAAQAGRQFDPRVVEQFMAVFERGIRDDAHMAEN